MLMIHLTSSECQQTEHYNSISTAQANRTSNHITNHTSHIMCYGYCLTTETHIHTRKKHGKSVADIIGAAKRTERPVKYTAAFMYMSGSRTKSGTLRPELSAESEQQTRAHDNKSHTG